MKMVNDFAFQFATFSLQNITRNEILSIVRIYISLYNDFFNDFILLTDPLGGSSLLNYLQIKLNCINYNCKINRINLFTNNTVETGLTESNYSKTN